MNWEWLRDLPVNPIITRDVILTVLIIAFVWLARLIFLKLTFRRLEDYRVRYQWRKNSGYIAALVVILVLGPTWIAGFQNAATYFGLLTAGLTIALQGLLVNLAGWIFIVWRRPFRVGDRIQIGAFAGDVIDIRIFQFTLLEIGNWVDADQSTGRILQVPNGMIFSDVLANYSRGFQYIWNEVQVLITFESNWREAKKMLLRIADRHGSQVSETAQRKVKEASRRFLIFYSKLTPTVYTDVKDYGIALTIRYLCDPRQRRGSSQAIWEDILDAFVEAHDIDFAYPTQRFYDNTWEGKSGTRRLPSLHNQASGD